MSIRCRDVAAFIEELAPVCTAEDWDNTGLIIGSMENVINRVILCLDVTSKVVDEAVEKGADLIIAHHPLIFNGMKKLDNGSPEGKVIYNLIKSDICVYCAHTNLDAAHNGVNSVLAETLGITDEIIHRFSRVGILENPQTLDEFIFTVKSRLNVNNIRLIGNIEGLIKKAAVFSGSFDGNFADILQDKADILVTGDIKYHTALQILELEFCVIDAGHFGTERPALQKIAGLICKRFPEISVLCNSVEIDPFKIC